MKPHCSKLPMYLQCPSSMVPPKHPLADSDNEPARLGRVVHDLIANEVELGPASPGHWVREAERNGVHVLDVKILMTIWLKIWNNLSQHFPEPRTEVKLESDLLIGSADIVHHDGLTAAVPDWKTGWADREYKAQVTGYASCMRYMWGMPQSGRIMAAPIHLRTDSMDVLQLDDDALDHFEARVRKAIDEAGDKYQPGEACTFCPRSHECDSRSEWLSKQVAWLSTIEHIDNIVKPEDIASLYPIVQAVSNACDEFRAVARSIVKMHGPQSVDNGRMLDLIDTSSRKIDPLKLRDIMVQEPYNWTKEDLYDVFNVRIRRLVARVQSKAPRGSKKSAKDRLMERLKEVGGIDTKKKQQLRVVKK